MAETKTTRSKKEQVASPEIQNSNQQALQEAHEDSFETTSSQEGIEIYIYGCALHVPGPPPTPMVWSPPYPTVLAATVVVLVLVLPTTSTT